MDIGEPRYSSHRVHVYIRTHTRERARATEKERESLCVYTSKYEKTADVCVKIDYTAGENVINSSTNKGLRRLYNANSKNRGGLRELRK